MTSGHFGEFKLRVPKGNTSFWKYGALAALRRKGARPSTGAFLSGGCTLEPPSNLNLLAPESPLISPGKPCLRPTALCLEPGLPCFTELQAVPSDSEAHRGLLR